MTTLEALCVYAVEHDQDRANRECGLISPEQMPDFECASLEEQDLQAFDYLSELANGGLVQFHDKFFRIDDRLENGNNIRSVIELIEEDEAGCVLAISRNHIAHTNGKNYFQTHFCVIAPDGTIHEPEVGSPEIQHDSYGDMILHALIAYDGEVVTLPAAA